MAEGGEDREREFGDSSPTPRSSIDMSVYYTPTGTTPLGMVPNPTPQSVLHSNIPETHSHSVAPGSGSTMRPGHIHKKDNPLLAMHRRLRSEADINTTGNCEYTKDTPFIYKDLSKSLRSGGKTFMMENRKFWNVLFMSVVTVERNYLGWNENTADLYQRLASGGCCDMAAAIVLTYTQIQLSI